MRIIGSRAVRLYPLYHPAAALYTPSMLETLRADFARLPALLELGPPEQPPQVEPLTAPEELDPVTAQPASAAPAEPASAAPAEPEPPDAPEADTRR